MVWIFFSAFHPPLSDAVQSQREKLKKIISSLQNRHIPAIASKIKENSHEKENLDKNRTQAGNFMVVVAFRHARERVKGSIFKSNIHDAYVVSS